MEYVDKKKAVDAVFNGCGACTEEIEDLPTVDIIRCKDCKHYVPSQIKDGSVCFLDAGMCEAEPDDFCSRGVRKDG